MGLSKNVDHNGWPTTKNVLKQSPKKQHLNQNINDSKISDLEFFLENIILGIQSFYIFPDVPVDISDFLAESFKANKKYKERSHILHYSFAQISSLILPTSTHLTFKILCSRNTAKKLSDFTNFQQICFCFVSENIFILHYFLTPKNCILESH